MDFHSDIDFDFCLELDDFVPDPEDFFPDQEDFALDQGDLFPDQEDFFPDQEDFFPDQEDFALDQEDFFPDQEDFALDQEDFALDQEDFFPDLEDFAPDQEDFHTDVDFVPGLDNLKPIAAVRGRGNPKFRKSMPKPKPNRCPTGQPYRKRVKTTVRNFHREHKILSIMINQATANLPQYRAASQQKADELARTLQTNGLKILQPKIAGSIGKRTSLGPDHHPDMDVALLLPEPEDTTFEGIEKYLEESLKKVDIILEKSSIGYSFSRETLISRKYVTFIKVGEQSCKLKVDIVTGIRFKPLDQSTPPDKKDCFRAQWERVMSYMAPAALDAQKFLSGSLAEMSTAFSRCQQDFVLRFVTLVRIWSQKNFKNGISFNGRATVFELIAIRAALDQLKSKDQGRNEALPLALERFFSQVKQPLGNIRISFEVEEYPEKLQPVPDIVQRALQESRTKYQRGTGLLLNPVNPYHNFLTDFTVKPLWEFYRRKAAWSYNMLQDHKKRSNDTDMSLIVKLMEAREEAAKL